MTSRAPDESAQSPGDELALHRGPNWPNRVSLAPLTNKQSHADGTLSDDEFAWLVARARGGMGLTMTCAAFVDPAGRAWTGQLGVADDAHLPGLTRLAEAIRAAGSVSAMQLHHGGARADTAVHGGPNLAPWDDPDRNTRALTTDELHRTIDAFVAAAVRAERAGFDGVQLHGAHGYLIGQFLDARSNGESGRHRTDGYGGSLEGRSRFLVEIVDGIRAATRPDFQLGVRLTPEGAGITIAESQQVFTDLVAAGQVDHIDMSLWDVRKNPSATGTRALIEEFTNLDRSATRLGVAGKIHSAADVRWALAQGADFVTVGTSAILHDDFAARAIAEPDFVSTPHPVSREYLHGQHLGEAFVDYLATGWDDFVHE